MSAAARRVERALFVTLLGTYAYFFQGGGWNQNGRIAQARALVERHTFAINDYMVYRSDAVAARATRLARSPVPRGTPWRAIEPRVNTADVAAGGGYYYPVKPPGAALLAALAYAPVYAAERLLGRDVDAWATLIFNGYWMTVACAGLAGATMGLVLLRTSRALFPDVALTAHAAGALTFGLGTLALPFSTMLFDHVVGACLGLLSFAALLRPGGDGRVEPLARAALAGLAAGLAVLTNYTLLIVALLLLGYLLSLRRLRGAAAFAAGMAPALLGLALYHWTAFGAPWVLGYAVENEYFVDPQRLLGLFAAPDPVVMTALLFSSKRGLFYTSPVLLCAFAGLGLAAWRGRAREAALALAVFACFWTMNGAFLHWHGSWSIGPRHLIPALPFVALGLPLAFARLPRLTTALALLSALLLLLPTAVDPQPPMRFEDPLLDYAWPLFRGERRSAYRVELSGQVSANPVGIYEGWFHMLTAPGSREERWNSFNLGELVWPERRLSLLPLSLWLALGVTLTLRGARAREAG